MHNVTLTGYLNASREVFRVTILVRRSDIYEQNKPEIQDCCLNTITILLSHIVSESIATALLNWIEISGLI